MGALVCVYHFNLNDCYIWRTSRNIHIFPILNMYKFLIRVIVGITCVMAVFIGLDYMISLGLQHTPKNHLETMNVVMHDICNNDILILGNSRGACGYNPYYLDSILGCNSRNISVSGQTYRISDVRYKLYRHHNNAPKILLLNIDHIELGPGTLGFEKEQYYPYIRDSIVQTILEINHFSWLDTHIPLYRYRGNYKYVGLGLCEFWGIYHLHGKQYKGWTKNPTGWHGEAFDEVLREKRNIDVLYNDTVASIFEGIVSKATEEGVKCIMVFSPIYNKVTENLSPSFDTIMDFYKTISQRYDVPILDYREMPICMDTSYFIDATHLNYLGAELFTKQLAYDIDSLDVFRR